MVIEALRPASPRLSASSPDLIIHDSDYDPSSGRTIILADNDMLVIDETISSPIAHVESIPAVKVQSVQGEDLIITLTKNGTLNYHNLSNFGYISSHILDQDINLSLIHI